MAEDDGGFVYFKSPDDEITTFWNMTRFEDFPEGLRTEGDDPNMKIRTYLIGEEGACIPLYQFTGTAEEWDRDALQNATNTMGDPKDGTVITLHDSMVTPGQFVINEFQTPPGASMPGNDHKYFQGFSYEELIAGFEEALAHEKQNDEVVSPCDLISSNSERTTDFVQSTTLPKVGGS